MTNVFKKLNSARDRLPLAIVRRLWRLISNGVKEPEFKSDFEPRYPLKRKEFLEKKEELKTLFLARGEKNFELMKKLPNRAKSLDYFEEISKFSQRTKEIENFKKSGGKVIGYFCNFVPEELIYAAGLLPIRLCSGFFEAVEIAEEVLPQDICPLIKSSFGLKLVSFPYFEFCDLIIVPTTCDGKKKLGETLSDWLPVWMLEVPSIKDKALAKEYWLAEIKKLKKKLEELTGNKITYPKLRETIRILRQRQAIFRKLYEIRKSGPVISGRDALLVIQTSFYDDLSRWMKKTEKLVQELEENIKKGLSVCPAQTPRLLLTGSPIIWPNYKLLNIVEEFGGMVAIDIDCSGTQHLYDSVEVDEWVAEEMLKAIAERYLLPSVCPCFISNDDRTDKLLQMIEDFKVDGVLYHQLRLCQVFDLEFQRIKQALVQKKIPLLRVQTDYSQEDIEQIKTRVEAFLEMLKAKLRSPTT